MRTPIASLASSILLAACVSGTGVYVPATTASAPPAAPIALPPVGVTIVQPESNRLLVSTNQPAYLAVFEIVPTRGVSLVYPTNSMQRRRMLAGSNWLPLTWRAQRVGYAADRMTRADRDERVERARGVSDERNAEHYIYVIASQRPLMLTDGIDDDDIRSAIGARMFRATDPYETMAELSRQFTPPGPAEEWGEDVYEMDFTRSAPTVHVARVYCPDGSVLFVRDEYVELAWCAYRGGERRVGQPPVPRPDSVVASNGHAVRRRAEPKQSVAVFRVQRPTDVGGMMKPDDRDRLGGDVHRSGGEGGVVMQGDTTRTKGGVFGKVGRGGDDHGNGNNDGQKSNNGNHYGWNKGKGNGGNGGDAGNAGHTGNAGSNGKDNSNSSNTNNGNANHGSGKQADTTTPAPIEKQPESPRKHPVVERDTTDRKDKP